jgi:hypothetical protein
METKKEPSTLRFSNDHLHNSNCYHYLLQLKPYITQDNIALVPELANVLNMKEYKRQEAYGNLYSRLISTIENRIHTLYAKPEHAKHLDDLIFAIYHNNNGILQECNWLVRVSEKTSPSRNASKHIQRELQSKSEHMNRKFPQKMNGLLGKFSSVFSGTFKPQHETNLPSIRTYRYQTLTDPVEYRFSTQGQRHRGKERVSPLFKKWLEINATKVDDAQPTAHIYFNNLPLDRKGMDIEGVKERLLSLTLHQLEGQEKLKIAVITLPAAKGLMSGRNYKRTHKNFSYQTVFDEFMQIVCGVRPANMVYDFWISQDTMNKAFGKDNPSSTIEILLTNSFEAHGLKKDDLLSTAQKQAVWVHFIKYELTNHILIKLKPRSFNFACRDAVDRAAVSSAYFNLMKSFETPYPMSKDEFLSAIELPAANVKARGMNGHRKLIWNAIDSYVSAHYDELIHSTQKAWLIYWRDMNCPHARAKQLLQTRMRECTALLTALPQSQEAIQQAGLAVLKSIQRNKLQLDPRLALEIISNTAKLLRHPSQSTYEMYLARARELPVKHRAWTIVAGFMKVFAAALLFLPSLGFTRSLFTSGLADARSGFFAPQKKLLSRQMQTFSDATVPQPAQNSLLLT